MTVEVDTVELLEKRIRTSSGYVNNAVVDLERHLEILNKDELIQIIHALAENFGDISTEEGQKRFTDLKNFLLEE